MSRLCIFAIILAPAAYAQAPTSVWDGVYTTQQATRGESGYKEACASCHGAKLSGSRQIAPLAGSEFTGNWNDMPLSELFQKMQDSMPADRPGQLSKEQNAAILAYILQFNQFPAGSKELPANADALKAIRFEAKRK